MRYLSLHSYLDSPSGIRLLLVLTATQWNYIRSCDGFLNSTSGDSLFKTIKKANTTLCFLVAVVLYVIKQLSMRGGNIKERHKNGSQQDEQSWLDDMLNY